MSLRSARSQHARRRSRSRRGFNLVELLIALSISAALLTATMVALDASFMAYQSTTEVASTHTVGRLAMHRMLSLIRTGTDFGPFPIDPRDSIVESDVIDFITPEGDLVSLEWNEDDETIYVVVNDVPFPLIEGVVAQFDPDTGTQISPFTLEFERARTLYRATIDLAIVPDDNMSVQLDGVNEQSIRLVASAMPRGTAFDDS